MKHTTRHFFHLSMIDNPLLDSMSLHVPIKHDSLLHFSTVHCMQFSINQTSPEALARMQFNIKETSGGTLVNRKIHACFGPIRLWTNSTYSTVFCIHFRFNSACISGSILHALWIYSFQLVSCTLNFKFSIRVHINS